VIIAYESKEKILLYLQMGRTDAVDKQFANEVSD